MILFFNLEKNNDQSRTIHALRSESGDLPIDPVDICKRAVVFHENLSKMNLGWNTGVNFSKTYPKCRRKLMLRSLVL